MTKNKTQDKSDKFSCAFKVFKWIFSRAAIFYFIIIIFSNYIVDYKRIKFGTKVRIIDTLMPASFHYLLKVEKEGKADFEKLKRYFKLYSKITEFFPERADAQSMLGFCYYHLGHTQKSINSYDLAIRIQPDFFWHYYNRGVVLYRLHRYNEALDSFKTASGLSSQKALEVVIESKVIYRTIWITFVNIPNELQQRLNNGYSNARVLAIASAYYQEDYSKMLALSEEFLKLNVDSSDLFSFYAGFSAYKLGRFEKAINYFELSKKIIQKKFNKNIHLAENSLISKHANYYIEASRVILSKVNTDLKTLPSRQLPLPMEQMIHPLMF